MNWVNSTLIIIKESIKGKLMLDIKLSILITCYLMFYTLFHRLSLNSNNFFVFSKEN
jgi:hypothetical protein